MSFGLGPSGFSRKRYIDVLGSMEDRARALFGETVNLSERSPLGILFRVVAFVIGNVWQLAESVFFSGYVDTAEGASLDYITSNGGVLRRNAERASVEVTLTGDNGTVIPLGFEVSTAAPETVIFETQAEAVIDSGTADVLCKAIESGTRGNVPESTITEIVNPLEGVDSVTNAQAATGGRNVETDPELRERYFASFAAAGASTIDSLIAALLRTPGVRAANVEEIENMEGDVIGFRAIVLGGTEEDVAATILEYKAWGVKTFGSESGMATAINGLSYEMLFDYAQEIDVYANIEITTGAAFPADGDARIQSAIAQYIGGEGPAGEIFTGLSMGQNVIYTRLYDLVYNVPGVLDASIEIGTDGVTFDRENIVIGFDEVAQTDPGKLVVVDVT